MEKKAVHQQLSINRVYIHSGPFMGATGSISSTSHGYYYVLFDHVQCINPSVISKILMLGDINSQRPIRPNCLQLLLPPKTIRLPPGLTEDDVYEGAFALCGLKFGF